MIKQFSSLKSLADRNSESDSVTNEDSSDNNLGPSMSTTSNAATTNNHHHNNTTTVHHETSNNLNHVTIGSNPGSTVNISTASASSLAAAGLNKNTGKNQLQISETLIAGGLGRNLPKKK